MKSVMIFCSYFLYLETLMAEKENSESEKTLEGPLKYKNFLDPVNQNLQSVKTDSMRMAFIETTSK